MRGGTQEPKLSILIKINANIISKHEEPACEGFYCCDFLPLHRLSTVQFTPVLVRCSGSLE